MMPIACNLGLGMAPVRFWPSRWSTRAAQIVALIAGPRATQPAARFYRCCLRELSLALALSLERKVVVAAPVLHRRPLGPLGRRRGPAQVLVGKPESILSPLFVAFAGQPGAQRLGKRWRA